MKTITASELRELLAFRNGVCVSLYLPTHLNGSSVQQDPIRLKNMVHAAEAELSAAGVKHTDAAAILAPARALVDNGLFWRDHSAGLALFAGAGYFRHLRLPSEVAEQTTVSDRFTVKPLLQLFADDGRFFVLALTQNGARLLEGTRYSVRDVPVERLPEDLASTLRPGVFERQLFQRTTAPRTAAAAGAGTSTYYGLGPSSEDGKDNIRRYLRAVDKALHGYLRAQHAPLVLAGVEYLLPLYRDVNSYPHLQKDGVPGNPDTVSTDDLLHRAWKIVEPHFVRRREQAAARYAELAGTGKATGDPCEAALAAGQGRVESLLVAAGARCWGTVDCAANAGDVHAARQPHDVDLLDFAAIETLLKAGTVHVLPRERMPGNTMVAAVFRF